jgi:hypothetical protein
MSENLEALVTVRKQHEEELLNKPNVTGVGVGWKITDGKKTSEMAIVSLVTKKLPKYQLRAQDLVPKEIEGCKLDVQESGVIRALSVDHKKRCRPVLMGTSGGHYAVTAGTNGCLVRRGSQVYMLSNNHVYANSNEAEKGDPILQPGPYDGGRNPEDRVATLEGFVPITFDSSPGSCPLALGVAGIFNAVSQGFGRKSRFKVVEVQDETNLVDCAIAKPVNEEEIKEEILEIGVPEGVVKGTLGMKIKKSGRTTGLTTGEIEQISAAVRVEFGEGRVATFRDQLIAGGISQGGDSGSAVLSEDNKICGLLFAGSESTTVINRIGNVLSSLNLSL